ncbi:hypothetical protein CIW83_18750 [Tissierella sp. P1]|uniref:hypothetical protein n=1 Tax=Tissierella sp. P1 TaxID=1280483 RepID=UPI000BA16E1D|nr:hypothetical protein [Tissierella sp. P1]OZV10688.1 hypothetical protein CIW83_18750 [Tissierella sp. P1]
MKRNVVILLLILILGGTIGGFIYYEQYISPSQKVIAYSDDLYLIVEDQEVDSEDAVLFYEDILYLSFPTIEYFVDNDIFYDDSEETLIITDKEKVLRYKLDDTTASINNKEFFITNVIKNLMKKYIFL